MRIKYFLPGMLLDGNGTLWVDLDDSMAQAYLGVPGSPSLVDACILNRVAQDLAHLGVKRARAFFLSRN